MKYIRIKDEKIIERKEWQDKLVDAYFLSLEEMNKLDIVKQADHLNELCDVYVVVYKDGECYLEYDWEKAREIRKGIEGILKVKEVYGALVTNKSINYVAKMDKIGRLCLL